MRPVSCDDASVGLADGAAAQIVDHLLEFP
jgi:hypothetical protein